MDILKHYESRQCQIYRQETFNATRFINVIKHVVSGIIDYPQFSILAPFLQNFLFFLVFYFAMFLNDVTGSNHLGNNIIENLIPGIACLIAFQRSYQMAAFHVIACKLLGGITDIYIAPLHKNEIIGGWSITSALYGTILGLALLIVASLIQGTSLHNLGIIIILMLIGGMVVAPIGVMIAIFSRKWDDESFFDTFFFTPILFFSGVFFPLSTLPPMISDILSYNPIAMLIADIRTAYLQNNMDFPVMSLTVNIIFAMILFFMVTKIYNHKKYIDI